MVSRSFHSVVLFLFFILIPLSSQAQPEKPPLNVDQLVHEAQENEAKEMLRRITKEAEEAKADLS